MLPWLLVPCQLPPLRISELLTYYGSTSPGTAGAGHGDDSSPLLEQALVLMRVNVGLSGVLLLLLSSRDAAGQWGVGSTATARTGQ